MAITTTNMYRICNKHQFFTEGTNTQYDKLFDKIREGCTDLKTLATIIWVCSEQSYDEIYNILLNEFYYS